MQSDEVYDRIRGIKHAKQSGAKQAEEEEEDHEPLPLRPSPTLAAETATTTTAAAAAKEKQISPDVDKAQQEKEGNHIPRRSHQQVQALEIPYLHDCFDLMLAVMFCSTMPPLQHQQQMP